MKKATRAWLEFAHWDLEAARLLAGNEYLSNVVLFHSQQCVDRHIDTPLFRILFINSMQIRQHFSE